MQVILQGSLRHFQVAELLTFVSQHSNGGPARATLDLEADGKRARIWFEGDKLLGAESSSTTEPLDALIQALEWREGSFTVLDSAVLPESSGELGLTLADVIAEAKRRREELGPYPDDALFHVVEDPRLQQISLTPDEFRLLFRLAPGRTFRELLADSPVPRLELAHKLKRLEELGLIFVADEAAVAPQAEEKERAPQSLPAVVTAASSSPASPEAPPPPSKAESAPPAAPPPKVESPFAPTQMNTPRPATDPGAEPTRPQKKTMMRKRTLVGSLIPDSDPETVYPLLDASISIGRLPDNTISIPDPSVSSHHGQILRTPEGFFIEDLQSRNGTFVNGEKVSDKRALADGDLIRVGRIVLLFNIAKESSASMTTQSEVPRE